MYQIWDTRTHAIHATESELQEEAATIYLAFSFLDEMLIILQTKDTTLQEAA
jgi:hypothetical protein